MKAIFVLCAIACAASAAYVLGVDTADAYTQDQWNCLKGKGYEFAIIRCFRSLGSVDPNCAETVKKARKAGFKDISIYAFPCYKCGDPAGQMKTLKKHVDSNNITFNQLWLDIEMRNPYWDTSSQEKNRQFFTTMANTASQLFGKKMAGVYTNKNGWTEIMGDWNGGASFKLWWAYWDKTGSSWDAFTPFNGWTKKTLAYKQFTGEHITCNMDVDENSYPK